ncbi:MAG: hypothetical protein IPL65_10945 [Lewinellaceae bacterium]|nr:hypothetical protein [Lewinellaceae bacterium]
MQLWLVCCSSCNNTPTPETSTPPATAITPVPLPTNIVPGFKFPEDTATIINGWLGGYTAPYFDTVAIYKHAWGIWAGLTAKSGQQYDGQDLLVYETWPGIGDIQTIIKDSGKDLGKFARMGRVPLQRPHQIGHARAIAKGFLTRGKIDTVNEEGSNFWVAVSYDPSAAAHTIQNKLLDSTVLKGMVRSGQISAIPAFPNNAITIKPTFFVGRGADSLIMMPVWSGPPNPAANYPDTAWHSSVWVDVHNQQAAGKAVVPVVNNPNPTPAQIAAATANLSDFIYYKIDKAAADYINKQEGAQGVKAAPGDLALLVAMHVGTKEMSNWDWQTFFWAPNPAQPPFPSNAVAAANRPTELQGAASHYAVSVAYAMVRPNQPISGGNNKGKTAEIGYNPYLEPGLGPINSANFPNKLNSAMMWGVQSNCMSCHALASYPGNSYTADQYIDLKDPKIYGSKLQLDFAWSILNNLTGPAPVSTEKSN